MQTGYFMLPLWRVVNNSHNFLTLLWAGCQQKGCGQFQIPYPQFNKKHDFLNIMLLRIYSPSKASFTLSKKPFFLGLTEILPAAANSLRAAFCLSLSSVGVTTLTVTY